MSVGAAHMGQGWLVETRVASKYQRHIEGLKGKIKWEKGNLNLSRKRLKLDNSD